MSVPTSNPIGPVVDNTPAKYPSRTAQLSGQHISFVGLQPEHAAALYPHISGPQNAHLWDYMLDGPFNSADEWDKSIAAKASGQGAVFYALVSPNDPSQVLGVASYLRIEPAHQCIEVGNILYTPALQRTLAATEAMYIMMKYAFEELGYRRYEWKCNALNAPSRRAALRLGFEFEGVFRNHFIIKGRSRDTAWYSILKEEWPQRKKELEQWLDPVNFDAQGKQIKKLEHFRISK